MAEYKAVSVGNVSGRWTKKGQAEEFAKLSGALTGESQGGWHLHSVQPIPVFGTVSNKQTGVLLLAVYARGE